MEEDLVEAAEEEEDFMADEVARDTVTLTRVKNLTSSKGIAEDWKVGEIISFPHKVKIMTIKMVGLPRQTTKRVVSYLVVKVKLVGETSSSSIVSSDASKHQAPVLVVPNLHEIKKNPKIMNRLIEMSSKFETYSQCMWIS